MNVINQSKPFFNKLLKNITRSFWATWGNKINICPSMCSQNLMSTSSAVVWNMGFCEYIVKIVTMNTLLRSVVNAVVFSRGLPDRAVVHGEWQKAPPCWLMMCCPMSPLGSGYWVSLFNLNFCLPAILRAWEKYWVLCIAHLPPISLKKQATTNRRHKPVPSHWSNDLAQH